MIFDQPARCIIGTIGMPGERTFYWQIKQERDLISIKLEKQQAAIIAEQIDNLLDENFDKDIDSGRQSSTPNDINPLDLPIIDEFNLLGLGIHLNENQLKISLNLSSSTSAEDAERAVEVVLSRTMARDFCARTRLVVAAGRAICPFCELPIEVNGHLCIRANGYRR
jgi:uncharacterized repeat protein (TIGR03847 family)